MDFLKKYMYPLLTGIGILAALLVFSLNVPNNREANIMERSVLSCIIAAPPAGFAVKQIC